MTASKSIHTSTYDPILPPFMAEYMPYGTHLLCPVLCWWIFKLFPFSVIVNHAVVNMGVDVSFWFMVFSGCMPRSANAHCTIFCSVWISASLSLNLFLSVSLPASLLLCFPLSVSLSHTDTSLWPINHLCSALSVYHWSKASFHDIIFCCVFFCCNSMAFPSNYSSSLG